MITISKYIEMLQKLKEEHGDLSLVQTNLGSSVAGAVVYSCGPTLRNLSIPTGREHVLRLHLDSDARVKCGVKVVKV